jgi:hypothetical protein
MEENEMKMNERLFAQATKVAIESTRENEELRTIMFLESGGKSALFRVEYSNSETNEYRSIDVRVESKTLSYKEQLEMANAYGIEPTDLKIVQEVELWELVPTEELNRTCELVSETYYDLDYCEDISHAALVIETLIKNGYSLDDIEDMCPRERFEEYEELC